MTFVTARRPKSAEVIQLEARAAELEKQKRPEEARDCFDAALRLDPSSQSSAEGRARVALLLKEQTAAEHCARALTFHDGQPDRQLRMIETAASELGQAAIPLVRSFVERHPEHPAAHELLAELIGETGPGGQFVEAYRRALDANPHNRSLLLSYWSVLSRSGRLAEALESMNERRSLFGGDRAFLLLEANIALHAGASERAGAALDRLDDRADAQLARGKHHLQTGRIREAAELLEAVVRAEPGNQSAWSLLEPAWRALGDERHRWLIGQPGLYGARDLALSSAQLGEIATTLRTLHQSSVQPIGQSVREGTQTLGQLFTRTEPAILMLVDALSAAVKTHLEALPPADPRHPMLRHRNGQLAFGPSWSVRLTGGGHHAVHFHPAGIVSSACYISVADDLGGGEQPGWLEIGRPVPELNLDLEPLAAFEPKPGQLVLFPSFLFHGTRPFTGGERLSVAFDVIDLG
jgi:tetratricopeptide (TPR) repeat protein